MGKFLTLFEDFLSRKILNNIFSFLFLCTSRITSSDAHLVIHIVILYQVHEMHCVKTQPNKEDKSCTSDRFYNIFQCEENSEAFELSNCLCVEIYTNSFIQFFYVHKQLQKCNS